MPTPSRDASAGSVEPTRSPLDRQHAACRRLLATGLATFVMASCGSDGAEPTAPDDAQDTAVASIAVTAPATTVPARRQFDLDVVLRNAAGGSVSGRVSWSSSDEKVLTVNASGMVTARLPGAATVTATSGSATGSLDITVELADVTDFVQRALGSAELPAMGGAIVTIDGIVAIGVAGNRRVGGPPVTLDDQWHIGSNLKAVTGFLCGIAVDDGVITWGTTVPTLFPELTVKAEYRDVTLRDLCTNQSGLPTNPDGVTVTSPDPRAQRNTIAAWAFEQSDPAASRGAYHYSNIGYAMAGAMMERAWNTTFEDALVTHLLDPIGVTSFGWGPQTAFGASNNPVPHRWNGSDWQTCEACDNPPWLSSAGRMHIRLGDWARIVQEMLRADQGTSSVIGASEGQTVSSGAVDMGSGNSYGYGWRVTSRPWANGRVWTHQGSNTNNSSVAWVAPDRDFALLALTNAGGGAAFAGLDQLVLRLLEYYEDGS